VNPYQPPLGQQDPTHPSGPIPLPRQPTWPETPINWAPPPQPPLDPGPPKRGWNTGVVVAVVVVVLLAVGAGGWFVWHRLSATTPTDTAATASDAPLSASGAGAGSASAGSASAGTPQAGGKTLEPGGSTASASTPRPAPDAEQAALNQLNALRDQSLAQAPLDGRWVAQLSSKSVGITDPLQTAANGTHTFYAADILAELQDIHATVGGSAALYLLWGTDFGKRSTAADGSPYWTTLADGGFASEDDVTAWCAATFPGLPADALADQCAARQLNPPHD
jgi:hypothetical protein